MIFPSEAKPKSRPKLTRQKMLYTRKVMESVPGYKKAVDEDARNAC